MRRTTALVLCIAAAVALTAGIHGTGVVGPPYGAVSLTRPAGTAVPAYSTADLSTKWTTWPRRFLMDRGTKPNTDGYQASELDSIAACHGVIFDASRLLTLPGAANCYALRQKNPDIVILGYMNFGYAESDTPNAGGYANRGWLSRAQWNALGGGSTPDFVTTAAAQKPWVVWPAVGAAADSFKAVNPYGGSRVSSFGDNGTARDKLAALVDSTAEVAGSDWYDFSYDVPPKLDGWHVDYFSLGPSQSYEGTGKAADLNADTVADWTPPSTWDNYDAQIAWRHWQGDFLDFMRDQFPGAVLSVNYSGTLLSDDQTYLPDMSGAYLEKFGYKASSSSFYDAFEEARAIITSSSPANNTRNVGWMMLSAERGDVVYLNGGDYRQIASSQVSRVQVARISSLLLGCIYVVVTGSDVAQDRGYFYAGTQQGPLITTTKANGRTRYVRQYSEGWARIVCHDTTGAGGQNPASATSLDSVAFDFNSTEPVIVTPEPPPTYPDTTPPVVTITAPTSGSTYTHNAATISTIAGTASDSSGIVTVGIINTRITPPWGIDQVDLAVDSTWAGGTINLAEGANLIRVWAFDGNNSSYDSLLVTYDTADVTAPTVMDVSSTAADGIYGTNSVIYVTVKFTESVFQTGSGVQLEMETGITDAVLGCTVDGSPNVRFLLLVAAGYSSPDLDYKAAGSLTGIAGGGLQDAEGNAAVLTLPAPGAAGSLGYNKNIVINTATPPLPGDEPGFPEDWTYKIQATVDSSLVSGSGTLTDFPALISLATSAAMDSVFLLAKTDGSDIRWSDRAGTQLVHEQVSYNATAKTAQMWVKLPALSKTNTVYWLHFGNAAATYRGNSADVWSDYRAAYHYESTPTSPLADSSPLPTDAIQFGAWLPSHKEAGKIGSAWRYAGGRNSYVQNAALDITTAEWTVSGWRWHDGHSTDFMLQGDQPWFHLASQASDAAQAPQYRSPYCAGDTWVGFDHAVPDSTWEHYAFVYNAAEPSIVCYVNGAVASAIPISGTGCATQGIVASTGQVGVGCTQYAGSTDDFDGLNDEFHIKPDAVSAAWVATEYNNQNDAAAFWTMGATTRPPAGSGTDGLEVTLTGSGFGTNALDVEWLGPTTGGASGWIEAQADDTDIITKANWGQYYISRAHMLVSSELARSGSKSMLVHDTGLNNAYECTAYYQPASGTFDTFYWTCWVYFNPITFEPFDGGQGTQIKFLEVTSNEYSDRTSWYWNMQCKQQEGITVNQCTGLCWIYCAGHSDSNNECWADTYPLSYTNMCQSTPSSNRYITRGCTIPESSCAPDLNSWTRVEIKGYQGTVGGADGKLRVSVVKPSGRIIGQDVGGVRFMENPEEVCGYFIYSGAWKRLTFLASWFGAAGTPVEAKYFFDDSYMSIGTEARVELGNAPSYANCTLLEVQPCSAWADGSITLNLNYGGSFHPGMLAYLHVIGADGTAVGPDPGPTGHAIVLE